MPPPVHLKTERLVLTMPGAEFASEAAHYVSRNRSHLERWEPSHPPPFYTEGFWAEQLERNRRELLDDRSLRLVLLGRERSPSPVVGFINFNNIIRGAFHACFLGYSLDQEHQGQGLMTEGLSRSLEYVFDELGIHRVMASHVPENDRSAALLARLGFEREGFARNYLMIAGRWRDHVLTAKDNPLWKPTSVE